MLGSLKLHLSLLGLTKVSQKVYVRSSSGIYQVCFRTVSCLSPHPLDLSLIAFLAYFVGPTEPKLLRLFYERSAKSQRIYFMLCFLNQIVPTLLRLVVSILFICTE